VLDEPTNHLDIESREALEDGLRDFAGTILAVSHDRWFLEKTAERLILIEDRGFVANEGSFAEYWRDFGSQRARLDSRGGIEGRAAASTRGAARPAGRPDAGAGSQSREDAASRARAGAARARLEARIGALEKEKEELERTSSKASSSRDYEGAGRAAAKARSASELLEKLYAEWEAS